MLFTTTVHHSTIACDMLWNNVQDATQDHSTSLQMTAVSSGCSVEPDASVAEAVSFQQLVPVPHKVRSAASTKKRRVGHAQCLTSSPYKRSLEEAISPSTSGKRRAKPKSKVPRKSVRPKRQSEVDVAEVDTTPCLFCCIRYNESSVKWWQCILCSAWVCGDCALVGKKDKTFICGQCY